MPTKFLWSIDELVAVDGLYRRFVVERQQAAGWKV